MCIPLAPVNLVPFKHTPGPLLYLYNFNWLWAVQLAMRVDLIKSGICNAVAGCSSSYRKLVRSCTRNEKSSHTYSRFISQINWTRRMSTRCCRFGYFAASLNAPQQAATAAVTLWVRAQMSQSQGWTRRWRRSKILFNQPNETERSLVVLLFCHHHRLGHHHHITLSFGPPPAAVIKTKDYFAFFKCKFYSWFVCLANYCQRRRRLWWRHGLLRSTKCFLFVRLSSVCLLYFANDSRPAVLDLLSAHQMHKYCTCFVAGKLPVHSNRHHNTLRLRSLDVRGDKFK